MTERSWLCAYKERTPLPSCSEDFAFYSSWCSHCWMCLSKFWGLTCDWSVTALNIFSSPEYTWEPAYSSWKYAEDVSEEKLNCRSCAKFCKQITVFVLASKVLIVLESEACSEGFHGQFLSNTCYDTQRKIHSWGLCKSITICMFAAHTETHMNWC